MPQSRYGDFFNNIGAKRVQAELTRRSLGKVAKLGAGVAGNEVRREDPCPWLSCESARDMRSRSHSIATRLISSIG